MQRPSFIPLAVLGLLVFACSSDEPDSTPGSAETVTTNNNPAAGAGGSASAAAPSTSGVTPEGNPGAEGNPSPAGPVNMGAGGAGDGSDGSGGSTMVAASGAGGAGGAGGAAAGASDDETMSFFVTSRGNPDGGDFGGIEGADAFCQTLAAESPLDVGGKTWRAYLSTSTEDARDRIGAGPWRNFSGRIIATDLEQLHDQGPGGSLGETWPEGDSSIALDEQGNEVPNNPVLHDIVTGTNLDGTAVADGTCNDWTSQEGATQNGHSNRTGGGPVPVSWGAAHPTGCGAPVEGQNFVEDTVTQGGGRGSIYCFSID